MHAERGKAAVAYAFAHGEKKDKAGNTCVWKTVRCDAAPLPLGRKQKARVSQIYTSRIQT